MCGGVILNCSIATIVGYGGNTAISLISYIRIPLSLVNDK